MPTGIFIPGYAIPGQARPGFTGLSPGPPPSPPGPAGHPAEGAWMAAFVTAGVI